MKEKCITTKESTRSLMGGFIPNLEDAETIEIAKIK